VGTNEPIEILSAKAAVDEIPGEPRGVPGRGLHHYFEATAVVRRRRGRQRRQSASFKGRQTKRIPTIAGIVKRRGGSRIAVEREPRIIADRVSDWRNRRPAALFCAGTQNLLLHNRKGATKLSTIPSRLCSAWFHNCAFLPVFVVSTPWHPTCRPDLRTSGRSRGSRCVRRSRPSISTN